jgi:PHS family inorganic phosphate transporter-like MFS transporter
LNITFQGRLRFVYNVIQNSIQHSKHSFFFKYIYLISQQLKSNFVSLIMGCVYFSDVKGSGKNTTPVTTDTLIKASAQVGALIGQISFGILGDCLGRKKMYGIELMIIVVATFASAFSADLATGMGVYAVLGMWRLILGVGIGGDYPMSAVITSEV